MALIEVRSVIAGSVWKIEGAVGDEVPEDAALMILESMKMEIPVTAPEDGTIRQIHVTEGQSVSEGDLLVSMET
jgi:acetyl-CoA carboxylase biotin carboxyl carrier protein